jgi:hypothetical protein
VSESGGTHPRDLLSAYLDDELGLDERQSVDRHLALCERCRKDVLSLKALARGVAEEPVPEVPPELALRISRLLDEAQVTPFKRRGFMIPATIAATAAAVGLVAVLQLRQRIEQETAPAPRAPVSAPEELQKSKASDAGARDELKRDRPVETPAVVLPQKDVFKEPAIVPERQDGARAKQSVSGGFAPAPASPPPPAGRSMQLDREADKKEAAREAPAEPRSAAGLNSEGYVGGVVGGVAGGVASSACAERWVDTAVLATWSVPNADAALMDLQGIARANGGRVERVDPYPSQFALIVPRGRLASAIADLRRHGVSGLDAPMSPEEGFDCVRQRVSLVSG